MKSTRIIALGLVLAFSVVALSSCGDRLVRRNSKGWSTLYKVPVTNQDEPWKIIEGIGAFGPRFVVPDSITLERDQAISIISGGNASGLVVEFDGIGAYFSAPKDSPQPEQHRGQFIARLLGAPVELNYSLIATDGNPYELDLFVRREMTLIDPQSMSSSDKLVTGPDGNELGWILSAFANSNLHTTMWRNYKDIDTNMLSILSVAMSRPINWGSYGGLIEQSGIATALRKYMLYKLSEETSLYEAEKRKEGARKAEPPEIRTVELSASWDGVQKHIYNVLRTLRKNQNTDGSFSAKWNEKQEPAKSDIEAMLYTALALEFMSFALFDDELRDDMPRDAAKALTKIISYQTSEFLSDDYFAAASAARALRLYNDRLIAVGGKAARYDPVATKKESACCD